MNCKTRPPLPARAPHPPVLYAAHCWLAHRYDEVVPVVILRDFARDYIQGYLRTLRTLVSDPAKPQGVDEGRS